MVKSKMKWVLSPHIYMEIPPFQQSHRTPQHCPTKWLAAQLSAIFCKAGCSPPARETIDSFIRTQTNYSTLSFWLQRIGKHINIYIMCIYIIIYIYVQIYVCMYIYIYTYKSMKSNPHFVSKFDMFC